MAPIDIFTNGLNSLLPYGQKINVLKFIGSTGSSDYDDVLSYTLESGPTWASGILLPIKNKFGSEDAILLEQGKLLTKDKKLYIKGAVNVSGNTLIGIGSPISEYYSIIPDGVKTPTITGSDVYSKVYLRFNHAGSVF